MENNEERLPSLKEYDGSGVWHESRKIPFGGQSLELRGMITGCGIAQVRNMSILLNEENKNLTKEEFIKKFDCVKVDGAGGVVCTLGESSYIYEKRILELGFEKISEYSNYRHGSTGCYKQRLYILKL